MNVQKSLVGSKRMCTIHVCGTLAGSAGAYQASTSTIGHDMQAGLIERTRGSVNCECSRWGEVNTDSYSGVEWESVANAYFDSIGREKYFRADAGHFQHTETRSHMHTNVRRSVAKVAADTIGVGSATVWHSRLCMFYCVCECVYVQCRPLCTVHVARSSVLSVSRQTLLTIIVLFC